MFRCHGWLFSLPHGVPQLLLMSALLCMAAVVPALGADKPKVRTITAFLRLDAKQYRQQIADALTMLRAAQSDYEKAGYLVETIRIATQPFPEYTRGMSKQAALAFFHDLDNLAKQENFIASIGPALMTDKDDPAQAELLAEILSLSGNISGSVVVAAADGVHWSGVRAAAGVIKYLEDNTDHSLGNFRFAAIANVPPYTPFFPAAYHQGMGHQFAVALESANVVAEVMAVQRDAEATRQALIAELGMHARAVENIASNLDRNTGWTYMGLDLSPAPMKDASIGSANR